MGKSSRGSVVIVKNFPNRALAEAARAILKREEIEAIVQGSDLAGTGMPQGFDVCVQAEDAEAARKLLEILYNGI